MDRIGRYACCTKGKWPDKLHAVRLAPSALIAEVALKHKEVAVTLTPPLTGFGFLSTSLAPKEEKRNIPELRIYLAYDLAAYYGTGFHGITRVGTGLSGREYTLRPPLPSAQTVRASAMLCRLPAPVLQTAGAVCATAQAL
jgi:hypothetical protein